MRRPLEMPTPPGRGASGGGTQMTGLDASMIAHPRRQVNQQNAVLLSMALHPLTEMIAEYDPDWAVEIARATVAALRRAGVGA